MATLAAIRDGLLKVFSATQADAIAHAVATAFDGVATRSDMQDLRDVVKDLAGAQVRTEGKLEELADAQNRTEAKVEELADAQKRTEVKVEELADAQKRTEVKIEELADAQKLAAVAMGELTEAQRTPENRIAELADLQRRMLIRLDKTDGRSFELFLRSHLPAYLGKHVKRCRVLRPEELVESLENFVVERRLSEDDVDDLRLADLVAVGSVEKQQVHWVGEVSCTADNEDIVCAARRAAILQSVGFDAVAFVACEAIGPAARDLAGREGVRILLEGRLLPAA